MPATQRRKIFPHLEDESKTGDKQNGENEEYNNAKSKDKSAKQHPSARTKKSSPDDTNGIARSREEASTHHLLPMPLVITALICSGLFWMSSFRDVMATGKPILDSLGMLWGQVDGDAKFLQYTKSTAWYDDSRGWKSKQGGLSAILPVTTDANNMGGLFVRKLAGAAGLAFHTCKLWPLVFQYLPYYVEGGKRMRGPSWSGGHYDPLLSLTMFGDVAVGAFYLAKLQDLRDAGTSRLAMVYVFAAFIEALVFGLYIISRRMGSGQYKQSTLESKRGYSDPLDSPNSLPSRIVARTVFIVSTFLSTISLRDLFFPGTILSFIPRDDIYLEWTGAFLHSPPPDTVEADEHGLEAPLYAGDKFVSQLMGLYISLCCMLKFVSAVGWVKGSRNVGANVENVERWGIVASKLIWKTMALGNMFILTLLRMFTPAAQTASLDLRWHLMMVAYEMFILFLYAFW